MGGASFPPQLLASLELPPSSVVEEGLHDAAPDQSNGEPWARARARPGIHKRT